MTSKEVDHNIDFPELSSPGNILILYGENLTEKRLIEYIKDAENRDIKQTILIDDIET